MREGAFLKHVVIVAHPSASSFTNAVARTYVEEIASLGHVGVLRDLYREAFEPRLHEQELPGPSGLSPYEDVSAERARLRDADVFAFVYPFWFYAPPAILIGYVQRIFGMGFGYRKQIRDGGSQPLLAPRKMISFSSTGSSMEWLRDNGAGFALQNILDQHLAQVCGLTILEHRHFDRVLKSMPSTRIEGHLHEVRASVRRHFTTTDI